MARYIHECSGGSHEVAVEILAFAEHEPGIVEKRIELIARAECLLLGRS